MLSRNKIIEYYSNEELLYEIYRISKNREVGILYNSNKFGQRPWIINYPNDVLEKVKEGAISFHISIERWENPLLLGKKGINANDIRIGWDLVFDIDSNYFYYSKIVAIEIIKFLEKEYEIENIFVKFSGNKGFHIIIPFEVLPNQYKGKPINLTFPDAGREAIEFVKLKLKDRIRKIILNIEGNDLEIIKKNLGVENLNYNFDPFEYIKIDSQAMSPRHLIRAPYSINEKSGLVSLPLKINKLKYFIREKASIENVEILKDFLIVKSKDYGVIDFFNDVELFSSENKKKAIRNIIKRDINQINEIKKDSNIKKIGIEFFPPCIKNILNGLEDGRKRGLFVLLTFLNNLGYTEEEIEDIIFEWNKKNKEPLKENYIKSQLKWFFNSRKKNYLTPNCDNEIYIKELKICQPDEFCENIKNPLSYVAKKLRWMKKKK